MNIQFENRIFRHLLVLFLNKKTDLANHWYVLEKLIRHKSRIGVRMILPPLRWSYLSLTTYTKLGEITDLNMNL